MKHFSVILSEAKDLAFEKKLRFFAPLRCAQNDI